MDDRVSVILELHYKKKKGSYEIDGFIWCTSFSLFDFFLALFRLALFGKIFVWNPTVTWM